MKGETTIKKRFGVVRLRFEGVFEVQQGLFEAPELMQGKAAIRERLGRVGPQFESLIEACNRRFFFFQQCLDESEEVKRVENILMDGNDLLAQVLSLKELPRFVR
jgi:hypothetical protein